MYEELTFLGLANEAVRRVRIRYPGAEFYEGFGVRPGGGPTRDVREVRSWRFVFRAGR